jgi:hypothetical protein
MKASLFIYPTDAQLDGSKIILKFTLKFTLKCFNLFRFNNHHQAATIRTMLKLESLTDYFKDYNSSKARTVAP